MAFRDVSTWKPGDRLKTRDGEYATLLRISRPNSEHKSAKVWVRWDKTTPKTGKVWEQEYYADVFTNETR